MSYQKMWPHTFCMLVDDEVASSVAGYICIIDKQTNLNKQANHRANSPSQFGEMLSVCLQTKWLWVRVLLQSLKLIQT